MGKCGSWSALMGSNSTEAFLTVVLRLCNNFDFSSWIQFPFPLQYTTIQLYCLYVEKFAFWLVIYIKTFNTFDNKTSTTQ